MSDIQIYLTSRFKKDLNKLAKRYRSIRQDLTFLTSGGNERLKWYDRQKPLALMELLIYDQ